MINSYLQYLQEGYLLSDKTISVNLDQFIEGHNKKLLIMGNTGSGKTTLAEHLAKKYKVKWKCIDSMYFRMRYDIPETEEISERKKRLKQKVQSKVIELLKNNERMIIEGWDLSEIYKEQPKNRHLILKQSMIVLGISALKAGIRAGIRNKNREGGEGWKELYWMTKINFKELEPVLKMLRKDIKRMPNGFVKEFKIPKL